MSSQRFVPVLPMTIWFCLILFMCLDTAAAASFKCHRCSTVDACAKIEEVVCPEATDPAGNPIKHGCLEAFRNDAPLYKECQPLATAIDKYKCESSTFKDNTTNSDITVSSCICPTELCNGNKKPNGGGGDKGGADGPIPWNNLFWIGLGLSFYIMH